jgi:sterol desaturase/sphingolipid hydroxylase (fatty acid hydroxylase superfamily)
MPHVPDFIVASWQQFQLFCIAYCAWLALYAKRAPQGDERRVRIGLHLICAVFVLLAANAALPSLQALTTPWFGLAALSDASAIPGTFAGEIPQYVRVALINTWQQVQLIATVYAIGLAIEALRPAHEDQPLRHVGFNLVYTALFLLATNFLVPPLQSLTKPWIDRWGLTIPVTFPDHFLGQVLQTLAFLFIMDFFYYWFHRTQHTFSTLWAQHKIHHSEFSLNITSGNRHHWLEEPLRVFALWLPIGLIFQQKPVTIAWLWSAFLLWGYFIHMNLRLPLGPLSPVFGGPQLHRIHHSNLIEHRDKNFAAFFPIFDVLFGTYYKPTHDMYPPTGLHDGEDLNGIGRASLAPFRVWKRQIRELFGSRSPEKPAIR